MVKASRFAKRSPVIEKVGGVRKEEASNVTVQIIFNGEGQDADDGVGLAANGAIPAKDVC